MGMMIGAGGAVVRTADPYKVAKTNNSPVRKTTNSNKKRKRLNYNYREVSGRILRAKTSVSATLVVTHARTKVAMLRRRYGCGEYDDRDLEIAIIHAEKMVRIAKKKLKNLKMEEMGRRTSEAEKAQEEYEDENSLNTADMQSEGRKISSEKLQDMIRELEQELQQLTAENNLDELTEECLDGGAVSAEELERIKKKHRCDEMRQIVEADMKYLKAMFQRMMQEGQEIAAAATLELSGAMNNAPVMISASAAAAPAAEGAGVDTSA